MFTEAAVLLKFSYAHIHECQNGTRFKKLGLKYFELTSKLFSALAFWLVLVVYWGVGVFGGVLGGFVLFGFFFWLFFGFWLVGFLIWFFSVKRSQVFLLSE